MRGVMKSTGITSFDAVIPNEIGGMNSFEAILAAHRFGKSALDSDLVARAYPKVWQTVRCLADIPVAPAALADGAGKTQVCPTRSSLSFSLTEIQVFENPKDNLEAEDLMRDACTALGSLSGMCVNPVYGIEARTLPRNSFSHGKSHLPLRCPTLITTAWSIGRSIALSRSLKQDPVTSLLNEEHGVLLFSGKITSVTRHVASGFTRGSVILSSITDTPSPSASTTSLLVDFENENLSATLITPGSADRLLAVCPDLITFLDKANGAPLGISDYRYGLRVSVIALKAPLVWTDERGLELGGPKAFGLDVEYRAVGGEGAYEVPRSVWEMFGEGM